MPFPGLHPPCGPGHPGQKPRGEELQLHHEFMHPLCWFLSLVVGADSWLKGDPDSLALEEGGGGNIQGKPEAESCEVIDLRDPEDPGSRPPPEDSPPGDTVRSAPVLAEPAGGLLQTPLDGSCSPWPLRTALGTRVACECVRAGGMEDAVAVKGVF